MQARFSVVDGLNNVICYCCEFESLDSFKNFVLDLYCLSFASEMAVWYFSLTSSIFRKFAGDCLNLYLLMVRLLHLFSGSLNVVIPPTFSSSM